MVDQEQYKESQAKRFFGTDVKTARGRLKKAYRFFEPFVRKNRPVLDIGTRDGWLVDYLRRKKFRHVQGIEITEDAVKYARSQGRNVIWGDAHDLSSFGDQEYGTILMIHSLEHCYKPKKVAKSVYRMLEPKGIFFIEVPLESDPNWRMAHYCNFTNIHDVVQLLDKTKFELLKDKIYLPDRKKHHIRHLMCAFRRRL